MQEVHLKGDHNLANMLFAQKITEKIGIDKQIIKRAIHQFKAVEHRLEYVKTIDNVKFYNDSKATNFSATLSAVESFEESIYLIIGGVAKTGDDYQLLNNYENIINIYAFGANKQQFTNAKQFMTLKAAVTAAFADAQHSDAIILLSPASASFDQYRDFTERGNDFKAIIEQLKK